MPFEYLPIMAQNSRPKSPRVLAMPSKPAWSAAIKTVSQSRVALPSSAALRVVDQQPFLPSEDLSYRRVPSGPNAGSIVIDHHSGIGTVPKQDREIVFPRSALAALVDHPVGRTFGPPNERTRHESVLTRALAELPNFTSPGEIRDLGCQWLAGASRAWEAELRAEMLHDR